MSWPLTSIIMNPVTAEWIRLLVLGVSKGRHDWTDIESNMAKFGRIKRMATATQRFLVQLKRHDEDNSSSGWSAFCAARLAPTRILSACTLPAFVARIWRRFAMFKPADGLAANCICVPVEVS